MTWPRPNSPAYWQGGHAPAWPAAPALTWGVGGGGWALGQSQAATTPAARVGAPVGDGQDGRRCPQQVYECCCPREGM